MAHEIKARMAAKKTWHGRLATCSHCGEDAGDAFFFDINNLSKLVVCQSCAKEGK